MQIAKAILYLIGLWLGVDGCRRCFWSSGFCKIKQMILGQSFNTYKAKQDKNMNVNALKYKMERFFSPIIHHVLRKEVIFNYQCCIIQVRE